LNFISFGLKLGLDETKQILIIINDQDYIFAPLHNRAPGRFRKGMRQFHDRASSLSRCVKEIERYGFDQFK